MKNNNDLRGNACIGEKDTWAIVSVTTNMLGAYFGLKAVKN